MIRLREIPATGGNFAGSALQRVLRGRKPGIPRLFDALIRPGFLSGSNHVTFEPQSSRADTKSRILVLGLAGGDQGHP
jgi:hypothetical protein